MSVSTRHMHTAFERTKTLKSTITFMEACKLAHELNQAYASKNYDSFSEPLEHVVKKLQLKEPEHDQVKKLIGTYFNLRRNKK